MRKNNKPRSDYLAPGKLSAVADLPGLPEDTIVQDVPLESIMGNLDPFQLRLEVGAVDNLCQSIKTSGQQVPIVLWEQDIGEDLIIIDGHRRVQALRELGRETVRGIVRDDLDEPHAYRLAWELNVERRGLGPLDKANALRLIREREGVTLQEAAGYLGLTRSTASRLVQLLELPEVLRKAVADEQLSPAHALHLGQHQDEDLGAWIKRVKEEGLGVRQLQKELGKVSRGRERAYLQRRGGGFRMTGFTFTPGRCDPVTRQRMLEALRRAVSILEEGEGV